MTRSSPSVWHKQALLEIAHPRALLLTACLSRLLVNRIAPPNLLPQHLPACFVTAQADAQSEHDAGVFPATYAREGHAAEAGRGCTERMAFISPQRAWERCRGMIIAQTADEQVWCEIMNTPRSMCDCYSSTFYCTSCCTKRGGCAARRDKRHQNRQLTGLKVKYIYT